MGDSIWQWSVIGESWPVLRTGAIVTVLLAVMTILVGTTLGAALGGVAAAACGPLRPARWLIIGSTKVIRAVPVLILLLFVHFALPGSAAWIHRPLAGLAERAGPHAGDIEREILAAIGSPAFASAFLALTLALTATVAEVVRHGVTRIPSPLVDTARAQGMGTTLRLRRLVVPETFRASVTDLVRAYMVTFQLTTLAAFLGCTELVDVVYTATNQQGGALELYLVLTAFFLLVLLPASGMVSLLDRSRWLRRQA